MADSPFPSSPTFSFAGGTFFNFPPCPLLEVSFELFPLPEGETTFTGDVLKLGEDSLVVVASNMLSSSLDVFTFEGVDFSATGVACISSWMWSLVGGVISTATAGDEEAVFCNGVGGVAALGLQVEKREDFGRVLEHLLAIEKPKR